MIVCVLGSGSKGNCIYVESHGTAVLIDQGFSHKKIDERLGLRGLDSSKIKALFVTHEHDDHIRGVGITARKLDIPIYGTLGTLNSKRNLFNGDQELIPIESGICIKIGSLELLPFSVSHDAVDPVQFCIHAGTKKTGIATDLGFVSTLVEQRLRESDIVIIESNHDVDMLKNGSYPWELKQRIMGRKGHLSNRNAADIIFNLTQLKSAKTILAHLSEENNTAELAENAVRELFERFDRRIRSLTVAAQDDPTQIIEI